MAFAPLPETRYMVVAIVAVDLTNKVFTGWNQSSGNQPVYATIQPGAGFVYPAVGEQWIVINHNGRWFLDSRTSFQDSRQLLPPAEGLTAIGSTGPTHLVGSEVRLPQSVFLGDWELRIDPATGNLQTRKGDTAWKDVGA